MNWLLSSIYETNYARVQLFLKLPPPLQLPQAVDKQENISKQVFLMRANPIQSLVKCAWIASYWFSS